MWLINTSTLRLEQILDPQNKKYAILSHTWEHEEVSFQEFAHLEKAKEKAGFTKIEKTCEIAKSRGLKYAWVDTCCIDKRSSAELTEAINSMFMWYKQSKVCFAHISDLPPGSSNSSFDGWLSEKQYRWFSRGWTLQELIAPQEVRFYDSEWQFRGNKRRLLHHLGVVTGIDKEVLADASTISDFPVGRRMSWASCRKTTRVEDLAYCLLGIFNVNMAMIYGEGQRAFIRLQEEIAKETNDLSLFAWSSSESEAQTFRGILAKSPSEFAGCHNIKRYVNYWAPPMEFAITNNGIKLEASVRSTKAGQYVLGLNSIVGDLNSPEESMIGIYLRKTPLGFVRECPEKIFLGTRSHFWTGKNSTIYITKHLTAEADCQLHFQLASRIYIHYDVVKSHSIEDTASSPKLLWDPHGKYFLTMESFPPTETSVYPLFTGFKSFNILYHKTVHVCSCLLICGTFVDAQDRERPCAVLYSDQDPSNKKVFREIQKSKDIGSGHLLARLRKHFMSKHSPDGQTLTWEHVCDRTVEVITPRRCRLRISLCIKLAEDESSQGDTAERITSPSKNRPGTDIRDLPDDFFDIESGHKCYTVSVHVRESKI